MQFLHVFMVIHLGRK